MIYDIDWKNNPTEFNYKLDENAEVKTETIQNAIEFEIDAGSKYVRATVEIDKSSDDVKTIGKERNPAFKTETLFLKSIIEGKASLYYYRADNLKRYFYSKDNSPITQFVYKRYRNEANEIAKNSYFKQQIITEFSCNTINQSEIELLNYNLEDLERLFTKYNQCQNITAINYNTKPKRDLFNLAIRPRVDFNSLSISSNNSSLKGVNFGNQTKFGVGLEAEYNIRYFNNRWSIIVETSYRSFKSEKKYDESAVVDGSLTAKIDYSSIEVPIGIRHTFFVNESSKIFLNAQLIYNIDFKPTLVYYRADGSEFDNLDVNSGRNYAFGAGYKFRNKYILEFRYQTSKNILDRYYLWTSEYNTMSIILGYNFL